ncbi:hypothetical protein Dsin_013786 [Dipteronia sinensis]|uniref:Cyanobacterial aminoacyl-tRNA synthetase CAAD domain-containing protein n=1 Tax=Dipteronia sinensis TaxID=43782 RepID=A0AAE0E9B6_9ROSI|nr:hypothetical protein Dsin_013786 [Dipteronia sinensis]
MASITANLVPPLLVQGRKTLFKTLQKLPVSPIKERQNRAALIVKATGESTESSTSLTVIKSVQNVWDNYEDRLGLIGLGFAAVVALWASINLITAIDKLPLIPIALEFVGILFSTSLATVGSDVNVILSYNHYEINFLPPLQWFIYRYLLFKPDREELFQIIDKSLFNVFGQ